MLEVMIGKNNNEILVRKLPDAAVFVAITVTSYNGIEPGDRFLSPNDGVESLIIGHSGVSVFGLKNPLEWGLKGEVLWAIKKDKSLGCFSAEAGETFNLIKDAIIKADNMIIAETAEEEINNFLNAET